MAAPDVTTMKIGFRPRIVIAFNELMRSASFWFENALAEFEDTEALKITASVRTFELFLV